MEVTAEGEVVFDMSLDGAAWPDPVPFSVFRADHLPEELIAA